MNEDVVNFIKSLGTGCRAPNDTLFRAGDEISKVHKIFGVRCIDDEVFYHKSYSVSCHIPGCSFTCGTIYEYDQHYNSCHRFSCSQCKKYLPSSHLLDLHLMETHDAYFAALAEKKPMFQCYLQECKKVFKTPQQRKEHGITDHKLPTNFRFDTVKNSNKKSKKKPGKTEECHDNVENSETSMEIVTEEGKKCKNPSNKPKKKPVKTEERHHNTENSETSMEIGAEEGTENKNLSNKPKKKHGKTDESQNVEKSEASMEVEGEVTKEVKQKSKRKPVRNIKPGNIRRPVLDLDCFVKDLKESLPTT